MTLIYEYVDNLYINLTNKCSCNCTFCVRNDGNGVGGSNLLLDHDPSGKEIIEELKKKDLSKYRLIVFCGFGEPTYNLPAMIEVGKYLKSQNVTVKLNTNGHGSHINGENIVPKLKEFIDIVSISLNQKDKESYQKVNRSRFRDGYDYMIDFIKACKGNIDRVVVSVVDVISEEDIKECERIAKDLGVEFRLRHYTKY